MAFVSSQDIRPVEPQGSLAGGVAATAGPVQSNVLAEHDVVLRFFPVFDLQRHGTAALFCTPMYDRVGAEAIYGHGAFRDVGASAWADIDCAILDQTLRFGRMLAESGVVVAVGASVSFATLNDPCGRAAFREALRAGHAREQANLVLKIEDIPDRTGGRRIGELAANLKLLVPRVWVHLPGSHIPLGGQETLHAQGLVLSMPARLPAHGMQIEARWLAHQARQQTAMACVDHVDSAAELEAVRAEGIRFVAGHALGRPALAPSATADEVRAALYDA